MGKIIELIKSFINPVQPEKSFDELALAAGIGDADLNELKKSMAGISWENFSREEEVKKPKIAKRNNNELNKEELKITPKKKSTEKERD